MDIYSTLNYPEETTWFEELDFYYGDDYIVFVSGVLEVTNHDYYVPYDGNLICGGYTETDTSVNLEIYDVEVCDLDGNEIHDEALKEEIIKEFKINTNY